MVIDMDGNENFLPDVAIPVASSVSFICRASDVKKSDFLWKKAFFSSQDYVTVKQSSTVVIDNRDGESKITLTDADFNRSGIYQCETGLHSTRVNLHIYGIVDSGGTDIKSSSLTDDLHNIRFTHNVPDIRRYPTAFCKFQVGKNGVNYATVRWYGKGLTQHRNMFEITESKDSETGVIYSNLTMLVTASTIRQELFGPYQCSFNILPGSSVKQSVYFRISPVLVVRPSAKTVYEGDSYNLTCGIIAYPEAKAGDITWRRNSQLLLVEDPDSGRVAASPTYDPEGRVHLLSTKSHYDTLSFTALASPDRAVYVCSVQTSLGNSSNGIFVRVKSAKATFWPLFGIAVELIILAAFILVYERNRRIKKSKPQPPTMNDGQASGPRKTSRESGVRQR
nr:hypothetical transcript [Hymenolepis microstoma]